MGDVVWVHDRAVITEREGARVIEGAFADITARHDAEVALSVAEDRFRTLVEQLPAITFIEEIDTGVNLYISPQIEAVYGYTPEEWMAEPTLWEQRLHPDDRDWVVASNAADAGDEWSLDYRSFTRTAGHLDPQRRPADPRRGGLALYWQGVAYDITERKHAEERLQAAEERYRTLIEQLPVAVYTDAVDDRSTALYISPQYEQLTGYTPEQRLLDPDLWVTMLHPDDRDRVLERSVETNETGEPFDIEYRIVAADGAYGVGARPRDAGPRPERTAPVAWRATGHHREQAKRRNDRAPRRDPRGHQLRRGAIPARPVVARPPARGPGAGSGAPARRPAARSSAIIPCPRASSGCRSSTRGSRTDTACEDDGTLDGFAWASGGFERWVVEMSAGRPIHGTVDTFPSTERATLVEGAPVGPFPGGDPDLRRRTRGGAISASTTSTRTGVGPTPTSRRSA